MGLRKSVFFIGAVLVLAACDRASSPTGPLSLHEGAASKRMDSTNTRTSSTNSEMIDGNCNWVRLGDGADSTLVCENQ